MFSQSVHITISSTKPKRGFQDRSRRSNFTLVLGFVVLSLLLLFYVWTRYHLVQMGYKFSRLTQTERRLIEEKRALSLELSNLGSLDRIERRARQELGMVDPRTEQVFYLDLSTL